jgi:hypothetical protein
MRDCLKFVMLTCAIGVMLTKPARSQEKAQHPNILYIVSDDQGWKDVGYHGSDIKNRPTGGNRHATRTVLRAADVHANPRCTDDRALPVPLWTADGGNRLKSYVRAPYR